MENITFERIKNDEIIREYIRRADRNLAAMGYTKHSFGHVTKVAEGAAEILTALGYDERTVELARIAGFLHDIGNVVNRADHAQSGAIMPSSCSPAWVCPPRRSAMWYRRSVTTMRALPSR